MTGAGASGALAATSYTQGRSLRGQRMRQTNKGTWEGGGRGITGREFSDLRVVVLLLPQGQLRIHFANTGLALQADQKAGVVGTAAPGPDQTLAACLEALQGHSPGPPTLLLPQPNWLRPGAQELQHGMGGRW